MPADVAMEACVVAVNRLQMPHLLVITRWTAGNRLVIVWLVTAAHLHQAQGRSG